MLVFKEKIFKYKVYQGGSMSDLTDQELFYTKLKNKCYKRNDLKKLRAEYVDLVKDYLNRINIIDKEINKVER